MNSPTLEHWAARPVDQRFRAWLLAIALVALGVRLFGLNWDGQHYFHPDERRIAEAVIQLSFHPLQLHPHFFAYGSLPFYVTRAATGVLGLVKPWFLGYDAAIFVGRALSAVWGAATVVLLGLLARRLYGLRVGLTAALLLTLSVFHVQNSHFATNDIPLTFLTLLALFGAALYVEGGRLRHAVLLGGAVGLAVATKFSALPLLLPLVLAVLLRVRREERFARPAAAGALALLAFGAAAFVGEPYALLDKQAYWHDILEQSQMVRHAGQVPYTNQYIGTAAYLYPLGELVLWGVGPALGLAALAGVVWRLKQRRGPAGDAELLMGLWAAAFFGITGAFDVKFPRYLLPLYPLLALWAAAALEAAAARGRAGRWLRGSVIALTALYLAAFLSIYTRPHTVVAASEWFYAHVRPGTRVLSQDWDEGFPFHLTGDRAPELYPITNFPYYEPDTPAKISRLSAELSAADVIVFQTKRLYGAVTRAPEKFPLTNAYFRRLFSGELGFELWHVERSRPGLFGVGLPSELADESFSVYDHPTVLVFKKARTLSAAQIQQKIEEGLPAAGPSRRDMLLARPAAPAMTEASRGRPGTIHSSLLATLLTVALLEALGLAAFLALRSALSPRVGLWALAKVVGGLLLAYVSWLAASLGIAPYTGLVILATACLLVAGGFALKGEHSLRALPAREIRISESIVLGTFFFFLAVRALNPEIYWGEKPMDFAFLNTLYRSIHMPPPEPWFAGSSLSYSYFGHLFVATFGKALGIDPSIQFNLGIAITAGLAAAAALAAGTFLGGRLRHGALAAGLILFAGNLSGLRELLARRHVNFDTFWATSRVVKDTVNEFPFWSFLFADLHAHLLAVPFALGFVAILLLWLKRGDELEKPLAARLVLLALGALFLGAVMTTNAWSLPTYVSLALFLLGIDWLLGQEPGRRIGILAIDLIGQLVLPALILIGGAVLLFLPYWRGLHPPPRSWGWEVGPYARLWDFANIFGLFFLILVPFFFLAWCRRLRDDSGGVSPARAAGVAVTALVIALSAFDLKFLAHGRLSLAPSVRTPLLALLVLGLYLTLSRRTSSALRLPLALFTFVLAVTAGCEVVFIWDRMNTLFKFYMDSWLLAGVAGGAVVGWLLEGNLGGLWGRRLWLSALCVGLALSVTTSAIDLAGVLRTRRVDGPRFTLDGTAYLATHAPSEAQAIAWLNRTIPGIPVLCEAFGPPYQEFSRITMNTGLPIVLGWDYHLSQRGQNAVEIDRRKLDVETIYTSASREAVEKALRRYHVALVYVGPLERQTYGGACLQRLRSFSNLLTPVYENGEVTVFAVKGALSGAPVHTIERVPAAAGEKAEAALGALQQPRSVAIDTRGNVYVADFGNHRIQMFDPDLTPRAAWGGRGAGPGQFREPCGVAVGADGTVYVADTWNGRVQVFDGPGKYRTEWSASFYGPRGIAVDGQGHVYVADTGNGEVVRFSPEGKKELVIGGKGKAPGKLLEPVGVAVDKNGNVVVCDNGNGRLQVFDSQGKLVRAFNVPGWRSAAFSEPYVAPDPDGSFWVTVPEAGEVRRYAADGTLLSIVGHGGGPGSFERPLGIALDPRDGTPLVSDVAKNRLVRLTRQAAKSPAPPVPTQPPPSSLTLY